MFVFRDYHVYWSCVGLVFFFQAEDGIRDLVRSRGLGDVYKRQEIDQMSEQAVGAVAERLAGYSTDHPDVQVKRVVICLLYTSDAADERSSVDLGGRRIIKKKKR